jgi:hypothetical protein
MAGHTEHTWVVDGIEEGSARIEEDGKRMLSVPLRSLPEGVREGQVLRVTRGPGAEGTGMHVSIVVDAAATAQAIRESVSQTRDMQAESRKRDTGGDVAL